MRCGVGAGIPRLHPPPPLARLWTTRGRGMGRPPRLGSRGRGPPSQAPPTSAPCPPGRPRVDVEWGRSGGRQPTGRRAGTPARAQQAQWPRSPLPPPRLFPPPPNPPHAPITGAPQARTPHAPCPTLFPSLHRPAADTPAAPRTLGTLPLTPLRVSLSAQLWGTPAGACARPPTGAAGGRERRETRLRFPAYSPPRRLPVPSSYKRSPPSAARRPLQA